MVVLQGLPARFALVHLRDEAAAMILDFFLAGPARVKGLLLASLGMAVVILALLVYGMYWRGAAYQARGERDVPPVEMMGQ